MFASIFVLAFHNAKRRRIFHKPARAADKLRLHDLIRAAAAFDFVVIDEEHAPFDRLK
jgi:hypothetical protein